MFNIIWERMMMRFLLTLIFLLNSNNVFPMEMKEKRAAYFKTAFRELEIFYQDVKRKYVREKKVDEKLLPPNFPEEIRNSLENRSLEELINLGKDVNTGRKDMELYINVYFERILSGEITPTFKKIKNKAKMQTLDVKNK